MIKAGIAKSLFMVVGPLLERLCPAPDLMWRAIVDRDSSFLKPPGHAYPE
jgi:hypothetical protein